MLTESRPTHLQLSTFFCLFPGTSSHKNLCSTLLWFRYVLPFAVRAHQPGCFFVPRMSGRRCSFVAFIWHSADRKGAGSFRCFGTALRAGGAPPLYPACGLALSGHGRSARRGAAPPHLPSGFAGLEHSLARWG